MNNLFRLGGIVVMVGFFLPWYEIDVLGIAKATPSGFKMAMAGGVGYLLFLIPVMGFFVLRNPTKINDAAAGLVVGLCLFRLGPAGNVEGKEIGYWITLSGGAVLFLTFPFAESE